MKRRTMNTADNTISVDLKKSESETSSLEKRKTYLKQMELSTLNIIPIKGLVDDGETGIELKNNLGYINLFKIESFDYLSMDDQELIEHIYSWDKFLRVHKDDIKWFAINMPINMSTNISFYTRKYNECKNPLYKDLIVRNINEFKETLRSRESQDFYLYCYGATYESIVKINASVRSGICRSRYVTEISPNTKVSVLRKFSNPYNTMDNNYLNSRGD